MSREIPAFKWGKLQLPDDMSAHEKKVFNAIAQCGFVSFVQAVANICRRQAAVSGRAQKLWEFRVKYFCRYIEQEKAFLRDEKQ